MPVISYEGQRDFQWGCVAQLRRIWQAPSDAAGEAAGLGGTAFLFLTGEVQVRVPELVVRTIVTVDVVAEPLKNWPSLLRHTPPPEMTFTAIELGV